jgi:hypothetical protein
VAAGEFPPQPVEISAACIVGAFTEALVRPVAPATAGAKPDPDQLIKAIVEFCARAAGSA